MNIEEGNPSCLNSLNNVNKYDAKFSEICREVAHGKIFIYLVC